MCSYTEGGMSGTRVARQSSIQETAAGLSCATVHIHLDVIGYMIEVVVDLEISSITTLIAAKASEFDEDTRLIAFLCRRGMRQA
jgi:hypothetical protein